MAAIFIYLDAAKEKYVQNHELFSPRLEHGITRLNPQE